MKQSTFDHLTFIPPFLKRTTIVLFSHGSTKVTLDDKDNGRRVQLKTADIDDRTAENERE